mgnify:CR=1 FL=1
MCKKIAYVLAIVILLFGCGPVLFTVGGHSVTLGGIVASETVKQVIKNEKKGTSENDERKN